VGSVIRRMSSAGSNYSGLLVLISGVPRNFVRGGQQIQLRTEEREDGIWER